MDAAIDCLTRLPKQPFGTVVHIGAGSGALDEYARLAVQHLVLVEADPDTLAELRARVHARPQPETITILGSFAIHSNAHETQMMVVLGIMAWILQRFGFAPSRIGGRVAAMSPGVPRRRPGSRVRLRPELPRVGGGLLFSASRQSAAASVIGREQEVNQCLSHGGRPPERGDTGRHLPARRPIFRMGVPTWGLEVQPAPVPHAATWLWYSDPAPLVRSLAGRGS